MVICPSCGSSRIRNDYKPAPFVLRMIGIRALLCDNCNFPFRAFSPLPPKTRRGRHSMRKADVFNPAPAVDLSQFAPNLSGEKAELKLVSPNVASQPKPAQAMQLDVVASTALPNPRVMADLAVPVRNDLRTEITRLHAQGSKDPSVSAESSEANKSSAQNICPECDSHNTRRRHRNIVERAVLSVTDHKPYVCRNCGASFYAKSEDQSHHSAVGSNEAA